MYDHPVVAGMDYLIRFDEDVFLYEHSTLDIFADMHAHKIQVIPDPYRDI